MNDLILTAGTCFLAGILTTVHPCPLTTSIAAVSFLTRLVESSKRIFYISLLFITGFAGGYLVLSILLSTGLSSIPTASINLQFYFSYFLGPVLILVGMFQANLIQINPHYKEKMLSRILRKKLSGIQAIPMGAFLALSFCPATAAIFFGIMLPLSIQSGQILLLPFLYALGASFPLITMSIFMARGLRITGNRYLQLKFPVIAGWILIFIGIYITIQRIY